MSRQLQGSPSRIKRLQEKAGSINIEGKEGTLTKVSVNLPAIVNRPTKESTISAYLKDGFSWSKFSPIIVAKFPNGDLYLLDGDHRRHMWKLSFPDEETISAYVVEVADEAEYHLLFAAINKHNRKQASAEETFLHEYLGGEPEAIKTATALFACDLAIEGSPDDLQQGYVGSSTDPLVTVTGFRRALKHGTPQVKRAAATIKSAWPADRRIQTELLDGLSLLYNTYPILSSTRKNNKVRNEFEAWFGNHMCGVPQKNKARDWKERGGNIHWCQTECTALGILKEFLLVSLPGGSKNKQRNLVKSRLEVLLEKDKK